MQHQIANDHESVGSQLATGTATNHTQCETVEAKEADGAQKRDLVLTDVLEPKWLRSLEILCKVLGFAKNTGSDPRLSNGNAADSLSASVHC